MTIIPLKGRDGEGMRGRAGGRKWGKLDILRLKRTVLPSPRTCDGNIALRDHPRYGGCQLRARLSLMSFIVKYSTNNCTATFASAPMPTTRLKHNSGTKGFQGTRFARGSETSHGHACRICNEALQTSLSEPTVGATLVIEAQARCRTNTITAESMHGL